MPALMVLAVVRRGVVILRGHPGAQSGVGPAMESGTTQQTCMLHSCEPPDDASFLRRRLTTKAARASASTSLVIIRKRRPDSATAWMEQSLLMSCCGEKPGS